VARLIAFSPASEEDFERLLDLRLRVMRPQLEAIGRFEPTRARERFRRGYSAASTRLVACDGAFAGCVTLQPDDVGFELMHFYVEPAFQGRGIGAAVLRLLCADADAAGRPIHLGVLKNSPGRRLYERHGFVFTHADQWDDFLRRPVLGSSTSDRPEE